MTETDTDIFEHHESDRPAPASGEQGSGSVVTTGDDSRTGDVNAWDPFGLRFLVIGWCLWLLVSWSISLTLGTTVHAVRWVVFSAVFGLMAVWPAFRLSQQPLSMSAGHRAGGLGYAVAATLLDWVFLVVIFQVVIWPLMLVGGWSLRQTVFLDAAILSWSLLTGLVLALGRDRTGTGARIGMMLICAMLLVGEPALKALLSLGGWLEIINWGWAGGEPNLMRISPVQALWELTTTRRPYDPSIWATPVFSTTSAALIGWILLGVMAVSRWGRRRRDARYRMA